MEAVMKFNPLINSLLFSLFLLLQSAKADISTEDAQNVLKAVKEIMEIEGIGKTFEIIKTHSASNSVSPDSKDQPAGVVGKIVQALGNSGAQVFCIKNSMLVASNKYPTLANGTINAVMMKDASGNQPFAQMIGKLKELKVITSHATGRTAEMHTIEMKVTHVLPHILDARQGHMLMAERGVLLAGRHELVKDTEDPQGKFFCGVDNVRSN